MTMSGDATRIDWTSPFPREAGSADAHLDVRLRSHGDDAWRRDHVECTVWSAELHGLPGTIDAVAHQALMLARL